jgi:hypothetical protein
LVSNNTNIPKASTTNVQQTSGTTNGFASLLTHPFTATTTTHTVTLL